MSRLYAKAQYFAWIMDLNYIGYEWDRRTEYNSMNMCISGELWPFAYYVSLLCDGNLIGDLIENAVGCLCSLCFLYAREKYSHSIEYSWVLDKYILIYLKETLFCQEFNLKRTKKIASNTFWIAIGFTFLVLETNIISKKYKQKVSSSAVDS